MTARQQSILIGAIVTGVLSTSYLFAINILCCLGVIVGGAVATQQYVSRTGAAIESGDGAMLGALAGVGGTVFQMLFNWILRPLDLGIREIMLDLAKQMQRQGRMSQQMLEQAQSDPSFGSILFNLVLGMVVYAIFGAIGGAIGAALFGEEDTGGADDVQTAQAEIVDE